MNAPVTLPRLSWGSPHAPRRALLVHGLGSSGALMWRFGTALADAGWLAVAVDLRGHGRAPRALDYSIAAYAADLVHTGTDDDAPWDLVVGHSLGGAAATVAAAGTPAWSRRLVLVDPAIHLSNRDRTIVANSQKRAFADTSAAAVRAEHPSWHEHDIELKALAAQQASPWAVAQTSEQNTPWDVRDAASRLGVPTHIIGSDPAVYSIFTGDLAAEVVRHPLVTMSVVAGAGHSPHRDRPDETVRQLLQAVG
ncbi:alpha/beta fold hydrolase [Microbacterium telephonicum]|uniref:Alpha-beta hydrolase superfamily lysophospholipase n=1 Tax=Microbacterium telephonicum TaxID=1714841 RepID=A0A498C733_9MICO|nr:alpha/beta hydrolase [Microbacterium telephonicum]RLK48900.1 alpha-beta hydrolase superfamily lysophospholipase [Microbacterium telephonicum]